MSQNQELDALGAAFLQSSIGDEPIAVRAEDIQQNGGIDFSKHFFEPKPGNTYLVKFLPNPTGDKIVHHSVYKNLPDPTRKGKTFHYVSSNNAKTCKALELFFKLHELKKTGDAIAEKKIENYMGRTQEGCAMVQILSSPDATEVGIIRMFKFSTFGPNAVIATQINAKLNPTKDQLDAGFEKEDIFNIFESSVFQIICEESVYENKKGRDYAKSNWAPKKRGAIAVMPDGTTREFTKADNADGKISDVAKPFFTQFLTNITNPDYSIYRYFAYKEVGDSRNDKDTEEYLKSTFAKVDEIIPVIETKSLQEIAGYGKADTSAAPQTEKVDNAKETLASSLPPELQGSSVIASVATQAPEQTVVSTQGASDEVANILNEE